MILKTIPCTINYHKKKRRNITSRAPVNIKSGNTVSVGINMLVITPVRYKSDIVLPFCTQSTIA